MVLRVFRSRLREEASSQYMALAQQMSDLARMMPGYRAHKVFFARESFYSEYSPEVRSVTRETRFRR